MQEGLFAREAQATLLIIKTTLKTKWEIYAVVPRAKGTSVALGAMAMLGMR
jgi:hypothetical protein